MKVKDLMLPLAECPLVREKSFLAEAVETLETWRKRGGTREYRLRVLLVQDESSRITGTLRQQDFLRVFAPGKGHGFFPSSGPSRVPTWNDLMEAAPEISRRVTAQEVMHIPGEAEFIDAQAPLEEGFYRLLTYPSIHLLVRSGEAVVGILRLSDLFSIFCQEIRKTELQ
jgi:CBS-domain-containing membrane protein